MSKVVPETPLSERTFLHEFSEWVECARRIAEIGLPSPQHQAVFEDIARLGGEALLRLSSASPEGVLRPTPPSHSSPEELVRALEKMSAAMAEDDGLWFVAQTAAEAYLQQALRKLCAAIEGVSSEECARTALSNYRKG